MIVCSSLTAIISKVTEAVLELTVPSFDTNEMVPALSPFKSDVGVNVAAAKAVFIAAKEPDAIKFAEPFPDPPKTISVSPIVNVPPVIVKVNV